MRSPVSFLATSDAAASLDFYAGVIGLTLVEDSEFALVFDDAGHMLRIQKVQSFDPAFHTVYGWQVADIEAAIAELAGKGAAFTRFDALDQSPSGVWTSPSGHKVAWFRDPCGNNLSLTQFA